MKVAHFCTMAPHRCGLYHTVKDLIKGERAIGIDAQMVNSGMEKVDGKNKISCGPCKEDGWLKTVESSWAKSADILVLHSAMPDEFLKLGKPVIAACHGRPESSFLMEHRKIMGTWSSYYTRAHNPHYTAFVTFWNEYLPILDMLLPVDKTFYVPPPVDLEEFNPSGDVFDWGNQSGSPNIIVADIWREDVTPFNVIMAAALFHRVYCKSAKIHIVGLPNTKDQHIRVLLHSLKKSGCLGKVAGQIRQITDIYRAGDIFITPHVIATRTVREALASGLAVVAGTGNQYTPYTANPHDIWGFAEAIKKCWDAISVMLLNTRIEQSRETAEKYFNPIKSAKAFKTVCEKVIEFKKGEKIIEEWKPVSDKIKRKEYVNYNEYLEHQKSKLNRGIRFLDDYEKKYELDLTERLSRLNLKPGSTALCLGARRGAEVRAFINNDCVAIGIDLNPGPDNKWVVTGDFHKIQYPSKSFDVVFTNCIDHVFDIDKFVNEIKRVLKPGGRFFVDIERPSEIGVDKYASIHWEDKEVLIKYLQRHFRLNKRMPVSCYWFEEMVIFAK